MRRFRFLLTVGVCFAAVGFPIGSSRASDLPARAPAKAPMYSPASVYNWTGFYVGVNAGYGWATASSTATILGVTATSSETLKGAIGGGQIGYNWQAPNNIVLGLEADLQASGQQNSTTATGGGVTLTATDKITYFGTVRGRLGYAINNWMPYVTGGWGYGQFTSDLTATGGLVGTVSSSQSHSLWAVGGGVEAALVGNWTWKVEYLYLDSGTITNNFTIAGIPVATSGRVKDNIARLGLNYRF